MARARTKLAEIQELKAKGLKNKEIGKLLDITPQAVWSNLQISKDEEKRLQQFQQDLPKHLGKLIAKITAQFACVDLEKTSPYQLAGMLSLLIDKQRLITGQSTSNQAVLFHIVEQACKSDSSFSGSNPTSEDTSEDPGG